MKIQELLLEQANVKHAYKAIIVLGSPGAGKNTIINQLGLNHTFKHEDLDDMVHRLRLKHDAEGRDKAWHVMSKRRKFWVRNSIPIIFNTTGRDYGRIENLAALLKENGYDVFCLIVFSSHDVAMQRIKDRPTAAHSLAGDIGREVDISFMTAVWNKLKNLINSYAALFKTEHAGIGYVINDPWLDPMGKTITKTRKIINRFLDAPIKNEVGASTTGLH